MRVGVTGVGVMGHHHARVYSQLDECELVGVHDTDGDRCREVAEEFRTRAFESLVELLEEADAVTVAVPTPDHHAIGIECLRAGCDVLVEKPLALSLDEADDLIRVAQEHERVLQVGQIERYNPAVEALDGLVDRPGFIEVDRLGSFAARSLETDVVLDLMIHDIDVVHSLVDAEVIEVRAVGVPILTEAIDFANARLEFDDGCIANLTASRVSAGRIRKVRIFQPEAYISVDYTTQVVDHYKLRRADGRPTGIVTDLVEVPYEEPLVRQIRDFLSSSQSRGTPRVDGVAGRRALATAFIIRDAIDQRLARSR